MKYTPAVLRIYEQMC